VSIQCHVHEINALILLILLNFKNLKNQTHFLRAFVFPRYIASKAFSLLVQKDVLLPISDTGIHQISSNEISTSPK